MTGSLWTLQTDIKKAQFMKPKFNWESTWERSNSVLEAKCSDWSYACGSEAIFFDSHCRNADPQIRRNELDDLNHKCNKPARQELSTLGSLLMFFSSAVSCHRPSFFSEKFRNVLDTFVFNTRNKANCQVFSTIDIYKATYITGFKGNKLSYNW